MLLKGCIAVPRFTGYASAWKLKLEDVSLIDPGGNTPTYDWTLPPEFRLENIITKMLSNTQTIVGHSLHRSPQGGGNTGATALSPYHRNGRQPYRRRPAASRVQSGVTFADGYDSETESSDDAVDSSELTIPGISLANRADANRDQPRQPRRNNPPEPRPQQSAAQAPRHNGACPACGKWGHPVDRCHYLAMYLQVCRFMPTMTAGDKRKIEESWVQKNKQWLKDDHTTPTRVGRRLPRRCFRRRTVR